MKVLLINIVLLLSICLTSTERLDEDEFIENRFNANLVAYLSQAWNHMNCDLCHLMFGPSFFKCKLICSSVGGGSSGGGSSGTTTAAPTTTTLGPCPTVAGESNFKVGSRSYAYVALYKFYSEAKTACDEYGMQLVTFQDVTEFTDVGNALKTAITTNTYQVWIGLENKSGTFTYIDGTPNTMQWTANADKTQGCGTLKSVSGVLGVNSKVCNTPAPFVCESKSNCV